MEFFKEVWNSVDSAARKGISLGLAIVMLFGAGYISGAMTSISTTSPEASVQAAAPADTTTTTAAQTTTTAVSTTTAAPSTTVPAPVEGSTTPAAPSVPSSSAPTSKEDIVALFNEAADKVKTDASKVTKNFENREYYADQSVIPSALQSLADNLIASNLSDDTEPIEYATKDDIIANYPVPGQSYSSKLTPADVDQATCNDNGTEYEITLNLATSTNPAAGTGVGAACDVIEAAEITSNNMVSSILKEFTVTYSGCVIKCKIDKATKHIVSANYNTPLVIDALASVVVTTVEAKVALSFEKDYTIAY